jgi:hypothetical protein
VDHGFHFFIVRTTCLYLDGSFHLETFPAFRVIQVDCDMGIFDDIGECFFHKIIRQPYRVIMNKDHKCDGGHVGNSSLRRCCNRKQLNFSECLFNSTISDQSRPLSRPLYSIYTYLFYALWYQSWGRFRSFEPLSLFGSFSMQHRPDYTMILQLHVAVMYRCVPKVLSYSILTL